jgi:hypothetical protein
MKTSDIDVKNVGYYDKINNESSNNAYNILTNITSHHLIDGDTGSDIIVNFKINPTYKFSYKYGDLIKRISFEFIEFGNDITTTEDTTTIHLISLDITDTDISYDITIPNDLYNKIRYDAGANIICNVKVEYDLDKYEDHFINDTLESLNSDILVNNYDYNMKPSNISTYSTVYPKKLRLIKYPSINTVPENVFMLDVEKKSVNTINVSPNISSLSITMDNTFFGHLGKTLGIHNTEAELNARYLGLVEVSQCSGDSILKRNIIDKYGNIVSYNKNIDRRDTITRYRLKDALN